MLCRGLRRGAGAGKERDPKERVRRPNGFGRGCFSRTRDSADGEAEGAYAWAALCGGSLPAQRGFAYLDLNVRAHPCASAHDDPSHIERNIYENENPGSGGNVSAGSVRICGDGSEQVQREVLLGQQLPETLLVLRRLLQPQINGTEEAGLRASQEARSFFARNRAGEKFRAGSRTERVIRRPAGRRKRPRSRSRRGGPRYGAGRGSQSGGRAARSRHAQPWDS